MTGVRSGGKILPRDTFKKTLTKVCTRLPDEGIGEQDEDVIKAFSAADQRRIKFRRLLDDNGISYVDIGSHSFRKGSATYCASGSTSAPPIVAICLRAGWKLGGVLNTYLSLESAGNRFVGRVCALLPQVSKEFCVLPPRFPLDMPADDRDLVDGAMTAMFGKYRLHGAGFACVLRHCLASLCYHQEWLSGRPACHPWHTTYLALNPHVLKKLHKMVGPLKYDGDDKYCAASGIPPWTKLALRVERLEDILKLLPERIVGDTAKLLDEKGALSGNITSSELRSAMEAVVKATIDEYDKRHGRHIPGVGTLRADASEMCFSNKTCPHDVWAQKRAQNVPT